MEIINELEPEPRGVYTGAIGYIAPNRQAQFNVAIRTVVVDKERERPIMASAAALSGIRMRPMSMRSVGSKRRYWCKQLAAKRPSFSLLESLLWTPEDGLFLAGSTFEAIAGIGGIFWHCGG